MTTPSQKLTLCITLAGVSLLGACGSHHSDASPHVSMSTSISSDKKTSSTPNTSASPASPAPGLNSKSTSLDGSSSDGKDSSKRSGNTESSSTTSSSQAKKDGSSSNGGSKGSVSQGNSSHAPSSYRGSEASVRADASNTSRAGGLAASRAAVSQGMMPQGSSSRQGSGQAVRIDIPSIGLHHSLVNIGLGGGVVSPAPYQLGIYRGYGRVNPGDPGVSVIAGHVTYYGPDVLYRLSSLGAGTHFTITYANGGTKTFVVTTGPTSIDKNAMQHDQRLWGRSSSPVVALISCDANSGWASAQHHTNNLVVWARPA